MIGYNKTFTDKLKNGDRVAQKELFGKCYGPMFRVCQRYIVQTDEAEDCLLKGFMKVFHQVGSFTYTNDQSLFYWVKKIMVNECLMVLRGRNNFNLMIEGEAEDIATDTSVMDDLHAEELLKMIMQLPSGYRTVFSLFVIEGYEHKEIAKMLGISESTSKTQLLKAKNKLKLMVVQQTKYGLGHGS